MRVDERHGVVVAGGGMAGLTAGATLAARGLPVTLFERNARPGGSCATFRRGPFRFDTGTSALSGLGPGGRLRRILDELGIDPPFARPPVRETVVARRFAFAIPSGEVEFREAFAAAFPGHRAAMDRLLALAADRSGIRPGASLGEVLAQCGVEGDPLVLLEALLGNLGVPASRADAATGLAFLREFLLDGGYYPARGMEDLVERLADRIRAGGGTVRCNVAVRGYEGGQRIDAALLDDGGRQPAAAFVSAMSARRTCAMAPAVPSSAHRAAEVARLSPSPSAFMAFLGLSCPLDALTPHRGHILSLPEEPASDIHRTLSDDGRLLAREGYVYVISGSRIVPDMAPPGGESLCLFVLAPYRDRAFWERHRGEMAEALLARAERVAPGISRRVAVMETATPHTLERYTGNDDGAAYGWEAAPLQCGASRLSPATAWDNLVLAGHWTRPGSGVSAAAASGYMAARMVKRMFTGGGHVPRD